MKRILARRIIKSIGIVIISTLLMLLNGCEINKETIKIGVVGTMTGVHSDLSVSGRRGIELAVDHINDKGGINGHQVELIVKNDSNNPERSLQVLEEFANEGISYVIGPYTSGMMLSAYEKFTEQNILYLAPTVSADNLSGIDDNLIRFIPSTKEQANIVNEIALRDGDSNFVVIMDQNNAAYTEYLARNFEEILEDNQGRVVGKYGFDRLDDDTLQQVVENIINIETEVDAVFAIVNAYDLAILVQELARNEINPRIYSSLWANTNDLVRVGGSYTEGIRLVSGIDLEHKDEKYQRFKSEYKERYGSEASFSSVYSYEAMTILFKILEEHSGNVLDVKQGLCDQEYSGLQGFFYIDEFGDNVRTYMMHEIINGEFIRID